MAVQARVASARGHGDIQARRATGLLDRMADGRVTFPSDAVGLDLTLGAQA